jgi:hypothetical protein
MWERLREWDYISSRLLWGVIFVIIFILGVLIGIGIGKTIPNFVISNDNARAVISTSNQILATILAIVISLTILAVEMTASKYSPRVIEIFKKNAFLWFFVFSYIFTIAIGLILLTFNDDTNFPISTTIGTIFHLTLGIFLLIMLIPYVLITLGFLNTEIIIKRLAGLIRVDTINAQTDPFQSVFDVIYGAIKNYDFTTMSEGLVLIESRFKDIIVQDPPNFDKQYIAFRYFDDMKRCGFLLLERNEEKYVFEIITRLLTISEWAVEKQDNIILIQTIRAIEEVGIKANEVRATSPAHHAITTLKELGVTIQKIEGVCNKPGLIENLIQIVNSLGKIAEHSVKIQQYETARSSIEVMKAIATMSVVSNVQFSNNPFSKNFIIIANVCIEKKDLPMLCKVISAMESLGSLSISGNRIEDTTHILQNLKLIGKSSGQKWFDDELRQNEILKAAEHALGFIAYVANQQKNEDTVELAIGYITDLHLLFPKGFHIFSSGLGESIQVKQIDYDCEYQKIYQYVFPGEDFPEDDEPFEQNYEDEEIVVY